MGHSVLKGDDRELDLVTAYTGHPWDAVIGLYFAQARMYDAEGRRFAARDMVRGSAANPATMVAYLYVLDNPVKWVDPTGAFLQGTRMTLGARDVGAAQNVLTFQRKLYGMGYLGRDAQAGCLDTTTLKAYEILCGDATLEATIPVELLGFRDSVDIPIWNHLGLPVNSTLSQEFFSGRKGTDTLSVTISGNNITIDYKPKIYVAKIIKARYFVPYVCVFTLGVIEVSTLMIADLSDSEYNSIVSRMVAGFKKWAGNYTVQGVSATVTVNVATKRVYDPTQADVIVGTHMEILLDQLASKGIDTTKLNIDSFGVVPGSFIWSTNCTAKIYMGFNQGALDHYIDNPSITGDKAGWDYVTNTSAHEFGHVLGLMDAYGAAYQPQAPRDRSSESSIMWDNQHLSAAVGNTEIEMLFYAWTRNKMQGYSAGLLGEDSQAFYH